MSRASRAYRASTCTVRGPATPSGTRPTWDWNRRRAGPISSSDPTGRTRPTSTSRAWTSRGSAGGAASPDAVTVPASAAPTALSVRRTDICPVLTGDSPTASGLSFQLTRRFPWEPRAVLVQHRPEPGRAQVEPGEYVDVVRSGRVR